MSDLEIIKQAILNDISCCVDRHIQSDGLRSVVVNRNRLKDKLRQIIIDRLDTEIGDE